MPLFSKKHFILILALLSTLCCQVPLGAMENPETNPETKERKDKEGGGEQKKEGQNAGEAGKVAEVAEDRELIQLAILDILHGSITAGITFIPREDANPLRPLALVPLFLDFFLPYPETERAKNHKEWTTLCGKFVGDVAQVVRGRKQVRRAVRSSYGAARTSEVNMGCGLAASLLAFSTGLLGSDGLVNGLLMPCIALCVPKLRSSSDALAVGSYLGERALLRACPCYAPVTDMLHRFGGIVAPLYRKYTGVQRSIDKVFWNEVNVWSSVVSSIWSSKSAWQNLPSFIC